MASIKCRHGGVEHRHDSVQAVLECVGAVAAAIDMQTSEYIRTHKTGQSIPPEVAASQAESYGTKAHEAVEQLVLGDLTPVEDEADEADVEVWKTLDPFRVAERGTPDSAERLAAEMRAKEKVNGPPEEPGIYLKDGTYYKVQRSRSSEHLYAKQGFCEEGVGITQPWTWEYAKGAIRNLRKGDMLTQEQATEFGKLWNICVSCFQELTREESMDRGYGPTCADNHGWEYNHSRKG